MLAGTVRGGVRSMAGKRLCDVCHQRSHLVAGHRTCDTCRAAHAGRRAARQLGGLTHREIAELLGMSKTRVQQIEKRALEKMRLAAELDDF